MALAPFFRHCFYYFGSFYIHYTCSMHIYVCAHPLLRPWEIRLLGILHKKGCGGAEYCLPMSLFVPKFSHDFWNIWPTKTGQWSFRLTHRVVADAGCEWIELQMYREIWCVFHLTGTYYTKKGSIDQILCMCEIFIAIVFCPYSLLLFRLYSRYPKIQRIRHT